MYAYDYIFTIQAYTHVANRLYPFQDAQPFSESALCIQVWNIKSRRYVSIYFRDRIGVINCLNYVENW